MCVSETHALIAWLYLVPCCLSKVYKPLSEMYLKIADLT